MTARPLQTRRAVLFGAAVTLAAPAIARAQAAQTFRLGHQFPIDHPLAQGSIKMADSLAASSGGRLKIQIFPSGQLGTGKEMDQQIADDSLDMTFDGPGILGTWWRPLTIFEAPFVSRDWGQLLRMMETAWGREQFEQMAQKANIRSYGVPWYYGARHFTTRGRALNTPADAKGLKIRVPEIPMFLDMIRAIGATPTPMALAEVYLSLQTGVADGQENPLPTINSMKFFEVQKFVNLTSHIITPQVPVMSAKRWAKLPEADRALFIAAAAEGGTVNDTMLRDLESRLVVDLKTRGMTVIEPDRAALRAAMAPLYEKNEAIWGKGVLAQLQAVQ